MDTPIMPTKQGQICLCITEVQGIDCNQELIVTDFIIPEDKNALITVVTLTELQRKSSEPERAQRHKVSKSNLKVLADDLVSYVEAWNHKPKKLKIEINRVDDIKAFFHSVHKRYPLEWHPDDDFKNFLDENGNRSFDDIEAMELNNKMVACFHFCDENDLDIYELAGEVQIEIWRQQGLWKDNNKQA